MAAEHHIDDVCKMLLRVIFLAAETQVKPDRALLFIIATCPDIMLDMVMDMTQCLRLHKAIY